MLLSCTILTRFDYDSKNNVDIFVKLVHFYFFHRPTCQTSILSYYYEKVHTSCVNLDVGVLIRLITCFI